MTSAPWITSMLVSATILAAAEARQPNVVIIFTDDQGTLDMGCYGSKDLFTPAMDGLAASGVRFTQAYSHTVCCPARAMLMTGRHPQRSDVGSWTQGETHALPGRHMLLREVTLAEALGQAGYATALFGKWHLGAHPDHGPTKQGFDEFFGIRDGFIDNYCHYQLHRTGYHDLFEGTREVFLRGSYFPDLIADRALAFIDRNKDRPFFLYFALNIPHYPEQPLERYTQRYRQLPEPRRSYAAIVSTTDDYVGRILTKLEAASLRDDTIVVLMSDNGHSAEDYQIQVDHHTSGYPKGHNYGANGGGGNTGKWLGAKGTFLEGGIRVPAILSYPHGVPKGQVRDQAITAMDWYPTILALCGVAVPEGVELDGHCVLPLIENANAPGLYETMHWQWQNSWTVRQGDWKLIANGSRGLGQEKLDAIHLGNLGDEHPELKNHASAQPEVVARLTKLHDEWAREVIPKNLPALDESLP